MVSSANAGKTLRAITRDSVRSHISQVAIGLFAEKGFDNVTVEEIAAEVGVSARSFHRYFATKEDSVIGDVTPWGEFVRDQFAVRPVDEPVWESLHVSFDALLSSSGEQGEGDKRGLRVLSSTASLRARHREKHLLWEQLLIPLIEARLPESDAPLRARVIVQAAIACFDTALAVWATPDENRPARQLLGIAFDQFDVTATI